MSDFTPTTEQVRKAYMYDPEDDYRDPVNAPFRAKQYGRQFDRWLAQHDAEVRKQVAEEIAEALKRHADAVRAREIGGAS